ncbi:hypothetical protein ABZT02_45290 [Streptomyces sp. NPDC005402]|uniref:hypothetical protein n=1 Tax=Streptomyces sp. NPDC005402 TaxID=3155338 RepID=UPI0033A28665
MSAAAALAKAGPALLREEGEPSAALRRWVAGFVDFLVTKHGLAGAMGADGADDLHRFFLDQLVSVCDTLLLAALGDTGTKQISGFMLMRGIGNLCIGAGNDARYDEESSVRMSAPPTRTSNEIWFAAPNSTLFVLAVARRRGGASELR